MDDHRDEAAFIADLIRCRDLIAGHRALPFLPSRPGRPPQTCAERYFYRGLPEAEWSAGLNAEILQTANSKVAMYDAYISEMKEMPGDALAAATPPLIRLPPHSRAHQRQPRCRPFGCAAAGHAATPEI